MPTRTIRGVGASSGISIGPIMRYEVRKVAVERQLVEDAPSELQRLEEALKQAKQEVHAVFQQAQEDVGSNEARIFEAHEMFLSDPELFQYVCTSIQEQHLNAAYAWQEGIKQYAVQLRAIGDDYLAARAVDLEDVAQRVLRILQGGGEGEAQTLRLTTPVVLVAHDLTPSETVKFGNGQIRAFCLAAGGPGSHVAILARALGIPAITGLGSAIDQLQDGLEVIVDGTTGTILIEPDAATLATYQAQAQNLALIQQNALQATLQPALTLDGTPIKIVANIGATQQVAEALANGAEGVGLLRTEFLFMERATAPSEEEQVLVYRAILEIMGTRSVVVRTLDLGGDKPAPYLTVAPEMNPFLGVRGVRLALTQPAMLQTQIRALLRASVGHTLKIMFPMVTSSEEIVVLQEQVRQAKAALTSQGMDYAQQVEIGIMVEVPAAALMADVLAEQVDFFSIGTNDLTQYTLAADRTNAAVSAIADALHPAVLRLIRMVVEAAHAHGKWVGLCGELAGDPFATPVLLGLGLDELSMTARSIPMIKQKIRLYSLEDARQIALTALNLPNAAEVRAYLRSVAR